MADIYNKNALSLGLSTCPSPCRDAVGTTDFYSSVPTCHLHREPDKDQYDNLLLYIIFCSNYLTEGAHSL